MKPRQTSINAYRAIESEKLLKGLQWLVYKTLFESGPLTQMECCRLINSSSVQDRSLMPRFAELERVGVITPIGGRQCRITKREVLLWDVTDKLPVKPPRPIPKDKIIKDLKLQLQEKERQIVKLKQALLDLRNELLEQLPRSQF